MVKKAADLYTEAELPLGDGTQTPDQFARMQSATTGLPEHMCRFNMKKNHFVLAPDGQDPRLPDARPRPGHPVARLRRRERAACRSATRRSRRCSAWCCRAIRPACIRSGCRSFPMQIGLVLKPGPQEPWTPYRMAQAFIQAGIPKQAIAIYPGLGDVGAAVLQHCPRSLIFGGTATVEQYKGNPRVQAHGPGFSKILLGDDKVDQWEKYLDIMVDSVFVNSGRGCINCSGIWVSRHGRKIAEATGRAHGPGRAVAAGRSQVGPGRLHGPGPGRRRLRRHRTGPEEAGVHDMTGEVSARGWSRRNAAITCGRRSSTASRRTRPSPRRNTCSLSAPWCECPQEKMLEAIGPTLVCSAITEDKKFQRRLARRDPHRPAEHRRRSRRSSSTGCSRTKGSIVDFLFRARAFQFDKDMMRDL